MTDNELLEAIQQMLARARQETDLEAECGPAWVHDQSLTAIASLVEMEKALQNNKLVLAPGFSFYEHLGASWVDLDSNLYDLVQRTDGALRRG